MRATGILSPLMQGWPPITLGSIVILSNSILSSLDISVASNLLHGKSVGCVLLFLRGYPLEDFCKAWF